MKILNWLEEKLLGFLWRRCLKREEKKISNKIAEKVDAQIMEEILR